MSDGKQSRPFSWRRSIFRRKNKANSQESIHHSNNATQNIEEPPIKVTQTTEQFDLTVSSQSTNPRPTSGRGDRPTEAPGTTATESDLWSLAYQELDEKSRKWIPDTSELKPESGKQWTTDLITLVREREEAYKDSTPKLKIGDREIIWRDYANKTVTWLVTLGDIAVNFAPVPSPIIRSSLKVFMKANVVQCEDLVAIFGCSEKVLSLMRRGMVYEEVYLRGNSSNAAAEDLQNNLIDLYKALLQFLAYAFVRLNEGQGRQFLNALISPGKDAELVSALSGHEHKLSMAVQACGAVKLQEHQNLLQSLSAPLRRVDENVKNLVEHLQEESLDDALDYISTIPIGKHHFEKREIRTPGTCEWLLKHRRFLDWEESSCSSTLWLQGSIGAGKSYLTSKVIDRYFFDNEAQRKHDEGFAYFYCSRSDATRRDPKSVYQSYIRQLARMNHGPTGMHKSISDLYRKAKKEQRELSITECKAALSELLKSYPQTTLVLDALDECEVKARKEIILVLRSLAMGAERPVKVYVASRREPDIERTLGSENLIEIGTSDNKSDIEKYIEQEMTRFGEEWESVSQDVREEVKRTITDQSDGMFRWAYLQWEQLKKFKTDQSILERLGKLPKSLEHAYDEIYSQNEEFELVILQRAVKWVLCAAEPLSNDVLLWAIRLEARTDGEAGAALTLSSPITQSTLESICCNLIVRDSQLKVWKFPHASAAEYFEGRHKDWTGKAHEDMAILLISYLIDCYSEWRIPGWNKNLDLPLSVDRDDYLNLWHPLQDYAKRFWAWHARNASDHDRVSPILKRFLGAAGPQKPSSQQYQIWCHHMFKTYPPDEVLKPDDLLPAKMSIFGICALGLHTLLEGWWDKDIDVSLYNDNGMNLLSIAASYGHNSLCSKLIDHGSDISGTLGGELVSALALALRRHQIETAALLLDKGFHPDSYSLCVAARIEEQVVEMLLNAGADPNIPCDDHCILGCALEAAVCHGEIGSAKTLIKYGADVNLAPTSRREEYGSPLAAAAGGRSRSLECVKLLIEHGANVDAQLRNGEYGSALAAAASKEFLECVKLLLEHGASANTQLKCGSYGSALTAAAKGGSPECVKLLLEHGANVNAQLECGVYSSALAAAATEGWLECVKLLVEHGADTNVQLERGDYGSALAATTHKKSPECLKLLVEHGADVNARLEHGKYGSALAAAADSRSLECVELLVELGADINAQLEYGVYGSALAAAASGGWLECVKLLVELGVDVNVQLEHGDYGSALDAALYGFYYGVEVVKYMVGEAGADASILSSGPRVQWFVRDAYTPKAKYLVEGGYVQASAFTDHGFGM